MESRGLKKKVLEFTERLTYSCATSVYPNSKNLAQYIIDNRYCESAKLKVLGNGSSNGIDTEFFQPNESVICSGIELKKKFGISDNDFIFLFVGRLVKDKGIEELIDAFCKLKQSHANIKLLLVGPFEDALDPIAERTKEMITDDSAIIHVGFQHDIRSYLAISHVLTFPSYREGFPNVPMQAGCFGIPCIVTDINGCNEIIIQEKNGLIIPVKDVEALYGSMLRLMTDQSLYLKLKGNARQMILDRYEQKKFWGILLSEYKDQLRQYAPVS